MRRFASIVLTIVCFIFPLAPPGALGQARSLVPPAGYEKAVDLAFQELEAGNYAEARSRFTQAYELYPNGRVLRALAMTEFELKNYAAAATLLEKALNSSVRPLTARQRADAEQLLEQARGQLARCTILTVPKQTSLWVDGLEAQLDAGGGLLLQAGEHTLDVRATGYQPERRALQIAGRVDQLVQIELVPLAPEPAPPASAPAPIALETESRASPVALRKKWWFWTGVVGVVAAGVATGVVLGRREPDPNLPSGGSTGVVTYVGAGKVATP
jgi:hypothetical protein